MSIAKTAEAIKMPFGRVDSGGSTDYSAGGIRGDLIKTFKINILIMTGREAVDR